MAAFVVIELSDPRLGLTHGVYRSDAAVYKAIALCYSATEANKIADALNVYQPIAVKAAQPIESKPQAAKEKKPGGRPKGGKR